MSRPAALIGARRPAHEVLRVERLARVLGAQLRLGVGKERDGRDAEPHRLLGAATMLSIDSRSTPGMEATGTRLLRALDDEQRPDQIVDARGGARRRGGATSACARARRRRTLGIGAERGRRASLRSGASASRAEVGVARMGWRGFMRGVRARGRHTHRKRWPLARAGAACATKQG